MTTTQQLPKAWTPSGYQERNTALRLLPDRVCVLLAAGWARSAMSAWEAKYPQDDRPRKAIEVAEGWALGTYTASGTTLARTAAYAAYAASAAAYAAYAADAAHAAYAAASAADAADAAHAAYAAYAASAAAYAANAANAANAASAADAAGNRWSWLHRTYCHARGPEGLTFDPAWKTGTAVGLAKEIVATRAFDLMPILADAIQDAGCDHADLLTHLRGDAGEMTLSDWTLAQLLGLWDEEVAV